MKGNKYISALLLIILIFFINILFGFINWNIDLTADNNHSLCPETNKIVNNLEDKLIIKIYLEGNFPAEFKKLQKATENLLKNLKAISDENIDFEFINPNTSNDNERIALFRKLVDLNLTPTDLDMSKPGEKINQIIFPGAIIYYKDKQIAVNFLQQQFGATPANSINSSIENLEFEFVSAIQNLTKNSVEKIAFLHGNGELNKQETYDLIESKDNFNLSRNYIVDLFNIKEFSVDSSTMHPDLSKQIAALSIYKVIIIAKPTIAFNELDKFLIDQYIMQGGKVVWLIDGVKADMDSLRNKSGSFIATQNRLNLNAQLNQYGVHINSNLIEDLRSSQIPIITGYSNNKPLQKLFDWPYSPLISSKNEHIITKGLNRIKCDFVSSIDTLENNINKTILLNSSKQTRLNPAPTKVSLGIIETPPTIISYNKKHEPIAVLLEGEFSSTLTNRSEEWKTNFSKTHQIKLKSKSLPTKMVVISDGDLISSSSDSQNNKSNYNENKHFFINIIDYLCGNISLSHLKRKELKLRALDKEKIQKNKLLLQLVNIILPLLIIILCGLFFIKNKKTKYA